MKNIASNYLTKKIQNKFFKNKTKKIDQLEPKEKVKEKVMENYPNFPIEETIKNMPTKPVQTNPVNNMNIVYILGDVLPDNTLIQTTYSFENNEALLLIKSPEGEYSFENEFIAKNKKYLPLKDKQIEEGIVHLPSDILLGQDPNELLMDIKNTIHKYLELDLMFEEVAARYVMMTWVYDVFQRIPYLRILGPYGSGKSRLLDIMAELTYHSSRLGVGVTGPNIYRWLENYPGTLIIDEAEFNNRNRNDPLIQILNGGYDRNQPVIRSYKGANDYIPRVYKAFGPKILASREPYSDDALESRILNLNSKVKTREDIPMNLPNKFEWDEMAQLRNRLLGFRFEYRNSIDIEYNINGISNYEPRVVEILSPLIYILQEKELPEVIKEFADQQKEEKIAQIGLSPEGLVADRIVELCSKEDYVYISHITKKLNDQRSFPYKIQEKSVGSLVRSLGLSTRRTGKGYIVQITEKQLDEISRRYGIAREEKSEGEEINL